MARARRTGGRHRRTDPRRIGLSAGIQGGHLGPDLRPGTPRGAAHGLHPDLRHPDPDLLADRKGRHRRRPRSVALPGGRHHGLAETEGLAHHQHRSEGGRSGQPERSRDRHGGCGRDRAPLPPPQGGGADGQHPDARGPLPGLGSRLPRTPGEGTQMETLRRGGGDQHRGASGRV